jgi:RNA-directed DNA polymerase
LDKALGVKLAPHFFNYAWKYDWIVEFDIKGLFDNIDHGLLMKAVRKHTKNKLIILYIERWLKAPMQMPDGTCVARTKGTPQGGVISPVLSNLFLHYVFDVWMTRNHSKKQWCRYADDAVVHCKTEEEAKHLLADLKVRFESCHLELHPEKTKVVYCQDVNRKEIHPNTMFTFLGYEFRRRPVRVKETNNLFIGFTPAVSREAQKAMRAKIREAKLSSKTEISLEEIASRFNPILRGWLEYYGKYTPSALYPVLRHFNLTLIRWAGRKYKRLRGGKTRASILLQTIMKQKPNLFAHWKIGMTGAFA